MLERLAKVTPKKSLVKKKISKNKGKRKDSITSLERWKTASSETLANDENIFNQNEENLKQKNNQDIDEIFNLSQNQDDNLIEHASLLHNGIPMDSFTDQRDHDFGLLFDSESIDMNSYTHEDGFNGNFNYSSSFEDTFNGKHKDIIDGKWIERPSSYGVMGMNFSPYINNQNDTLF